MLGTVPNKKRCKFTTFFRITQIIFCFFSKKVQKFAYLHFFETFYTYLWAFLTQKDT